MFRLGALVAVALLATSHAFAAGSLPRGSSAVNSQIAIPLSVQSDIHAIAGALKAANAHPNEASDQQRAKDNLEFQRGMAASARTMSRIALAEAGITLIGVVLVGFTLIATKAAAKAARDAVNKAQETMEQTEQYGARQLRAYIFVTNKSAVLDEQRRLTIKFQFKNMGQTPAYNLHMSRKIRIATDVSDQASPSATAIETGSKESVGPNDWRGAVSKMDVSEEDELALLSRTKSAWLFGEIRYQDAFGVNRRTEFRYYLSGEDLRSAGVMMTCWYGNQAD